LALSDQHQSGTKELLTQQLLANQQNISGTQNGHHAPFTIPAFLSATLIPWPILTRIFAHSIKNKHHKFQ